MNLKRLAMAAVAVSTQVLVATASIAIPSFSVSVDGTINYNPGNDSFSVNSIVINNPPGYIQVDLSVTDLNQNLVSVNDDFKVAVGQICVFENSWTNPDTGGVVNISGDNSTVVLLDGSSADVQAALANVAIYQSSTHSCDGGSATKLNQKLLFRKLQVSAIASAPGLKWSPQTQHYYQLATQTSDDGMGHPTDNSGNITDSSRFFVKWSTARANAKSSSITINGETHRGYLASIITKDEFNFLNNNVSGGSGTLYPAWVGGSDAASEGEWKWVDGPEAAVFGGDSLVDTTYVDSWVDPYGIIYKKDGNNQYFRTDTSGTDQYLVQTESRLQARDSSGTLIIDSNNQPLLVDTSFCVHPWSSTTLSNGVFAYCNWGNPVLYDVDGVQYGSVSADYSIPKDANNNILVDQNDGFIHQLSESDLTSNGLLQVDTPNYEGATFWGPDGGENGLCTLRGSRGTCQQSQTYNGTTYTNNYYVYWSNGDQYNEDYWDGVHYTQGDGVYSPQPDNAALNGKPDENALVINWCQRNSPDYQHSSAIHQSLYGNTGYMCTPGWNDLAHLDWGGGSASYPNGYSYDTPNQIGTTDYVIEYCGYSDEAGCETDGAAIAYAAFGIDQTPYQSSDNKLRMSFFSNPGVQNTTLSTDTMTVESFDDFGLGYSTGLSAVGDFSGNLLIQDANLFGGADYTGRFPTGINAYLTLPTTERYLGFWWSAGNSGNYVELLDSSGNLLETITTANVVSQLGPCDGTNPYCGNPNDKTLVTGEPFAYINLRYPAGFNQVRFHGTGFEFDNLAISVSVPARSAGETLVSDSALNTSCADIDATTAAAVLTACPQSTTIDIASSSTYNLLADSQIAGYSYGGDVSVLDAAIFSGDGAVSVVGSDSLSLSSSTVGTYYIDYTITNGFETAISRLTVTVVDNSGPPPSSPPRIDWYSPISEPTFVYDVSFIPTWYITDTGGGVSNWGTAVRQVATYAGDMNCMSDWTTDNFEVYSETTDTVDYGHCYRYTFDPEAGGQLPEDNTGAYPTEYWYSNTLIVPYRTTLVAPSQVLVDPRHSRVASPAMYATGGDVQACVQVVNADGNNDWESNVYLDLGGNGYMDETVGGAMVWSDQSRWVTISGTAEQVTSALGQVFYQLSSGKFSQSYRIFVEVGPWIQSNYETLGCTAALAEGQKYTTIDPYGLKIVRTQQIALTPRNH